MTTPINPKLLSLFSIILVSPITINFVSRKPSSITVNALNVTATDNGSMLMLTLMNEKGIVLHPQYLLYGSKTNPPYSSTPPGTGAGDTWTNSSVQTAVSSLLGTTTASQLTFIRNLYPSGQIL